MSRIKKKKYIYIYIYIACSGGPEISDFCEKTFYIFTNKMLKYSFPWRMVLPSVCRRQKLVIHAPLWEYQ